VTINNSKSWNYLQNVPQSLLPAPTLEQINAPSAMIRGALFSGTSDDSRIYLYGGTTSFLNESFAGFKQPSSAQQPLWSYDVADNGWSPVNMSGPNIRRLNGGAYAEAPDQGLAFYFNGQLDNGSDSSVANSSEFYEFVAGMLVIDFTNEKVRNISTDALGNGTARVGATLQYLPTVGEKGALVLLGGGSKEITDFSNDEFGTLHSMAEITIIDIAALLRGDKVWWFRQDTGPHAPPALVDFCAIVASAQDNSSHNIYVYGGRNKTDIFGDVWVLSLPQFVWTHVLEGTKPRYGITCHKLGNQQMLILGGRLGDLTKDCGISEGVFMLDITSLQWITAFQKPDGQYNVPKALVEKIGGR
jgi:hypothetical protein